MAARHNLLFLILFSFLVVIYALTVGINSISPDLEEALGIPQIFVSSIGNISDLYTTDISPAGWTFIIWAVIYSFQLGWILMILVTLCVTTKDGAPLYTSVPIASSEFLAVFIVNLFLNVGWLVLFDRQELLWAFCVLVLLTITLYFCIANHAWLALKYIRELSCDHKMYLLASRILLLNGMGIYATWVSIASLLNLNIVLVYIADMSQQIASIIALAVLAAGAVLYLILEHFIVERYLRYLFTPWMVICWALAGSLEENWNLENPSCIMSIALVGVAVSAFVTKVAVTAYRSQAHPLVAAVLLPTSHQRQSGKEMQPISHRRSYTSY